MIIHSVEYYHALKQEMESLKALIDKKPYSSDVVFLNEGIKDELRVCNLALNSVNCQHCLHHIKAESRCAVLGSFPPSLDRDKYSCVNWVFDDIPF